MHQLLLSGVRDGRQDQGGRESGGSKAIQAHREEDTLGRGRARRKFPPAPRVQPRMITRRALLALTLAAVFANAQMSGKAAYEAFTAWRKARALTGWDAAQRPTAPS